MLGVISPFSTELKYGKGLNKDFSFKEVILTFLLIFEKGKEKGRD